MITHEQLQNAIALIKNALKDNTEALYVFKKYIEPICIEHERGYYVPSVDEVKTLRDISNFSLKECKTALIFNNGDITLAKKWLIEKGQI